MSKVGGTTGDNCAPAAKAAEAQHEIRFAHGLTQNHMWADSHFAPQNTLLLGNTLLLSGMVYFASQLTFLLNALYSPEHFTLQHTLLPGTISFMEHGSKEQSGPESKVC